MSKPWFLLLFFRLFFTILSYLISIVLEYTLGNKEKEYGDTVVEKG